MKFTIIKSCLARFSGIFALGTPSNIHGSAISYHCAKFGAFVNSVTILTLRDLTTVNIPSLSSQSQRAKNTIHCFRSLKHYLISGLTSVYTSWLAFWSEFLRHLKSRNLSKILLFFARLYLFSTFLLISHSSIENTFILGGDRQSAC